MSSTLYKVRVLNIRQQQREEDMMVGDEVEFAVEQPAAVADTRPYITVEVTEGTDSLKVTGPEALATHLISEFRTRQDQLREQSIADAGRLGQIRREMMGGPMGVVRHGAEGSH